MLPYVYRVTMYDPADRDAHGHYTGPEDTVSDHGPVEAAYLQAVAAFARDSGVDRLAVREPGIPALAHFGVEKPVEGFGLDGLLPSGLAGFHDGAEVPLAVGLELVRAMLRDNGAWCRLEVEETFAVHVGWDQYLYVGSSRPCPDALALTRALGLFPERLDASPYRFEDEEPGIQRPGDDAFWAELRRAVDTGVAGLLEETYADGGTRWHRLSVHSADSADSADRIRTALAPRARLEVWPPLSPDVETVLATLPADATFECVWQDAHDVLHSVLADETDLPELLPLVADATAAAVLPLSVDDRVPLFTAVMPDPDGVLRARWRTTPTPLDLTWSRQLTDRGANQNGRST
ncbi:RNA-binding protein [Streptomyces sp. NPDC093105]|uniref:RNA-binding protein n=1 Tax=Streptomyces sp. NPDC093105 TaxID=3366029 RepID=UPI003825D76F